MPTGGCLLLLQSWAWWRVPFLCLRVNDLHMFPLVTRYILWGTSVPNILCPHDDVNADTNAEPNADACTVTSGDTNAIIDANIAAGVNPSVFGFCNHDTNAIIDANIDAGVNP
ncbi:hypothetical protein PVK06_017407 [Gossypium arboreum]|uniref:Uncharacterized protein n=1 Tax=Gossypium arboreum TaxID=29729 RepID=A0ABR0Q2J5_GOSAR|nr:hypothetical protein PVK06_017407 [Gossypium arboreum]